MGEKTKKNNSYNGPFLGLNSEVELFDKLFEKSIFIFPEFDTSDRWSIAGFMTHLIYDCVTQGETDDILTFNYKGDDEGQKFVCYLERFSTKCFAIYTILEEKNVMFVKLNRKMIKKLWLRADHKITERELRIQFINTITGSIREILNVTNGLSENIISSYNTNMALNGSALKLMMLASALKAGVKFNIEGDQTCEKR